MIIIAIMLIWYVDLHIHVTGNPIPQRSAEVHQCVQIE